MNRKLALLVRLILGTLLLGLSAPMSFAQASLTNLDLATIQQRADGGDPAAENELANRIMAMGPPPVQAVKAIGWYQKAAQAGNADAEASLAGLYWSGRGTPRDLSQSFYWYLQAAKQGNHSAEEWVAKDYRTGLGVAQDYSQSMAWLIKASDYVGVGDMYRDGVGVPQSSDQALAWYQKGVALHDSQAESRAAQIQGLPDPHPAPQPATTYTSPTQNTAQTYVPPTNPRDAVTVSAFATSGTTNGRPDNSVWVQYQNNNDYNVSAHSVTTYVCGGKSIRLEDTELVLAHQSTKQWLDTCFSINIPGGQQNDGIASNVSVTLISATQQ